MVFFRCERLPESGRTQRDALPFAAAKRRANALSFIRTVTVGFGLTPNLLTPIRSDANRALAGLCAGLSATAITAGGEFRPALRTLPWALQPVARR
jgi:hypothetical protein